MKRFLIPLLAALALPAAVNAESWYLLTSNNSGTHTVKMRNKPDCDYWAKEFVNLKGSDHWKGFRSASPSAICVLGK